MTDRPNPPLQHYEDTAEGFDALEQERLARVVRSLLNMFLATAVCMAVVGAVLRDAWIVVLPLAAALGLLAPYALLLRGRIQAAIMLTAIMPIAIVTLNAATGEGLRDLSMGAYGIIIVCAGLTLERRGFLRLLAVVAVCLLFVSLNYAYAWLPLRPNTNPHWADLIIVVAMIAINAAAVLMLANHGRTGLETAYREIGRRRQIERELAILSSHDVLTGVYSRRYFEDEVARLDGTRRYPISVISADVDDLKGVNDGFGHAEGDLLLIQAAGILGSVVRTDDVLARLGGDEFVILLPQTDAEAAAEVLSRVRDRLDEQPADQGPRVSLSIGVATAEAGGLADALRLSDARMYEQKAGRRAPDSRR